MREIIKTDKAPAAVGPYSQAVKVKAADMIFCSGQIPLDPRTGEVVGETAAEQTRQVMTNLKNILEAAGSDMSRVTKMTIFVLNMDDFGAVNEVYTTFFRSDPPARATIEARRLPKDVMIEIDAIALA